MNNRAIALIGPPACGKGTQAQLLEERFSGMYSISTGDLIRRNLNDFSGAYVDDSTIEKLLEQEIENSIAQMYVLDGVPRTFNQISMVDRLFSLEQIFYFDKLTDEDLIERMNNRGRDEDYQKRIDDYLKNSAIVPQFLETYRSDSITSLDARESPEEIHREIIQVLGKMGYY